MKKIELNTNNKGAFDKFKLHDKAKNTNQNTIVNHQAQLRMFLGRINADWDKVDQKVLDQFFANAKIAVTSKEIMKPVIKAFYRFHGKRVKDKGLKKKDNGMVEKGNGLEKIADMIISNGKVLTKPTKGEEAVITPAEIDKLIEAHHDLSRKALVETFVVTGARKEEIRNLNLGDVKLDGNLVWVNIRKPKGTSPNIQPRNIPIAPATGNPVARYPEHLVAWVQSRKHEDPSRPLFVSNSYKKKYNGNRLTEQGVYDIIADVKAKSGVKRKITPHIFRHTSATYDGATLNESMLCQKYGWVIGSTMARRYCHFNEQVLGEQILKRAGLKQEEAKKGKICPRCGEPNNVFAEECSKCHQILSAEKLLEQEASKEQEISKLKSQVDLMEQMMRQITDKMGIELEEEKERKDAYQEYQRTAHPSETRSLPDQIKKEIDDAGGMKEWSKKKLAEHKV